MLFPHHLGIFLHRPSSPVALGDSEGESLGPVHGHGGFWKRCRHLLRPNWQGLGLLIENLYSDTDPDRKVEMSGCCAVHRTRKKQLCFAWPIALISCSRFFISWKQSAFTVVCLLCLLCSHYRVFLPVSPPPPWVYPCLGSILFLEYSQD